MMTNWFYAKMNKSYSNELVVYNIETLRKMVAASIKSYFCAIYNYDVFSVD